MKNKEWQEVLKRLDDVSEYLWRNSLTMGDDERERIGKLDYAVKVAYGVIVERIKDENRF